jgi:N-acetyl-gamma-glutamyl-phosphate reductase
MRGERTRVAVLGATGYAGIDLVRLLVGHPSAALVAVHSESFDGRPLAEVYPGLLGLVDLPCRALGAEEVAAEAEVAFLALPHRASMEMAARLDERGVKVLDLSADLRFRDPKVYEAWYKVPHTAPALSRQAVYGLPELHRDALRAARVVAVPGCYPTGALLGLAPLVRRGLVDLDTIVIDAISGASGAGRKPAQDLHFAELNENLRAYEVASHRHTPEIEQELTALAGRPVTVTFTPHLAPVTRGILTTVTAGLGAGATEADLAAAFEADYKAEPFARFLPGPRLPETKPVQGSNACHVGFRVDRRAGRAIIVTALDNLVKGAGGQAVQAFNLLCGHPEDAGLRLPGLYP